MLSRALGRAFAVRARATEQSADSHTITRKHNVQRVEHATKSRPSSRRKQPSQSNGTVRFSDHLQLAHHPTVRKDAVNNSKEFLASRAVARRVKVIGRRVFKRETAGAIS